MKKTISLLLSAIVLLLVGCNSNEPELGDVSKLDKSLGCLNGDFSVAKGKYVRFSMGNLQYIQSTKRWSFAANQYDMIGWENVRGDEFMNDGIDVCKVGEPADTIDMFCWGTGNNTTFAIPSYESTFADWGVNAISNGGNQANLWRTLTYEEWRYILLERPQAERKCGVAVVNGVNGLILLPDNWKQPTGINFKSGYYSDFPDGYGDSYVFFGDLYAEYQSFTLSEWQQMESAGAVFFPAVGVCNKSYISRVGWFGFYWTSTLYKDYTILCVFFSSYEKCCMTINYASMGSAVRLVQDVR